MTYIPMGPPALRPSNQAILHCHGMDTTAKLIPQQVDPPHWSPLHSQSCTQPTIAVWERSVDVVGAPSALLSLALPTEGKPTPQPGGLLPSKGPMEGSP